MTELTNEQIAGVEALHKKATALIDNDTDPNIAALISHIPALCQTVRVLRAEKAEQRGLTLISALVNFADWLHAEGLLSVNDERERAQLVLQFFDAHSKGENYFMQAEQIMEILGKPFQET